MDTVSVEICSEIFQDDEERVSFVRSRILGGRPSWNPIERAAEPVGLGRLLLRHDGLGQMQPSAALFVSADEFGEGREMADAWLRTMHSRDILAVVLIYALDAEESDFASLEPFVADWFWSRLPARGERVRYEGLAYPICFARGISFLVEGEHVIEDVMEEGYETWFECRNVTTGERVWVPQLPLLAGAPASTA